MQKLVSVCLTLTSFEFPVLSVAMVILQGSELTWSTRRLSRAARDFQYSSSSCIHWPLTALLVECKRSIIILNWAVDDCLVEPTFHCWLLKLTRPFHCVGGCEGVIPADQRCQSPASAARSPSTLHRYSSSTPARSPQTSPVHSQLLDMPRSPQYS